MIKGPLAFAAYNSAVATALLDLHDGAVVKGSLSAHVRELAILVPLVVLTIWYGVQPGAILDVFAVPTEALLKSTQAAAQAAQSVASAVR